MEQSKAYFIKGMVCERCIGVIKTTIEGLELPLENISLGKITLSKLPSEKSLAMLKESLAELGFKLLSDKRARIVGQVKTLIQQAFAQPADQRLKVKFSTMLATSLNMNYDSISEAFSASEGLTLEHFIIGIRLEKVKELLVYTNLTLTEIAYQTGFSSITHLSRQFKELTGLAPSHFRQVRLLKQTVSDE